MTIGCGCNAQNYHELVHTTQYIISKNAIYIHIRILTFNIISYISYHTLFYYTVQYDIITLIWYCKLINIESIIIHCTCTTHCTHRIFILLWCCGALRCAVLRCTVLRCVLLALLTTVVDDPLGGCDANTPRSVAYAWYSMRCSRHSVRTPSSPWEGSSQFYGGG